MRTRKLGSRGDAVSVIGLGAWPIGGGMGIVEERDAVRTIHAAIDLGITLIDTAEGYRSSEAVLGTALAGGKRHDVFLATKVSFDFSPDGIRAAAEKSLRSLKSDYIDLYQIHSWNDRYPVEQSIAEMARLREEGKIRFIGVSNYSVEQHERAVAAAAAGGDLIDATQPRYNLFDREIEADVIPYCGQHEIGILAHSIFAKGLLTGRYRPDHVFPPEDERSRMPRFQGAELAQWLERAERLRRIATAIDMSLVQLAIAWTLRLPGVTCALAGAKSAAQVEEQAVAGDAVLDAGTLAAIEEVLS